MRSALGCAALGVLLLVVAGTFDAEPLYVTGSALALLGAGAAAWIGAGAWGATVEREISARSVLEEQPLDVRIRAGAGRLPLPPGWIDEPLLPEPVRFRAGKRRTRVRVEVTFGRRGRRRLAPPVLVLRDPFGLAQHVVTGANTDEVLVLPRVYPVRAKAGGGDATPAHARAALIAAAETEIDGLREHRPGSPASRIHWPALAKGQGLMERKLISEADSRPLIVLDPRAPSSQDALDAAVRAATSLTVHFAKRSGVSLLLPGDRRAHVIEKDLVAWPAAHVRLALLDDAVGPSLVAAQNRRGLVVLVAARLIDRPPRGLGRTPGGCMSSCPARCRTAVPSSRSPAARASSPRAPAPPRRWRLWRSALRRVPHSRAAIFPAIRRCRSPPLAGCAFMALAAFGGAALDGAARAGRARTVRCTRSVRASSRWFGMLGAARLPEPRARAGGGDRGG